MRLVSFDGFFPSSRCSTQFETLSDLTVAIPLLKNSKAEVTRSVYDTGECFGWIQGLDR